MSGISDVVNAIEKDVLDLIVPGKPAPAAASSAPVVTIAGAPITLSEIGQSLTALGAIWDALKAKGGDVNLDLAAGEDIANILAEIDPPLAPFVKVAEVLVPLIIRGYATGAIKGDAPYSGDPTMDSIDGKSSSIGR